MIWEVLDRNARAIELYQRMGGTVNKEWLPVQMNKKSIQEFIS